MGMIYKEATLAAIAVKAKAELANANHYFAEGVQFAIDIIEAQPEYGAEDEDTKGDPERIKCKDCRYHFDEDVCIDTDTRGWRDNDFCSKAERRTDEDTGPIW